MLLKKSCKRWALISVLVLAVFESLFAQVPPPTYWWNDAVFYEVFVRSYKDSDGDGKGDFRGLIDNLDYLNDGDTATHNDLGITAIWLMPIQQSPSYHGYDVIDYRTIEQDYGTNADFHDFITEAHNRGIKVIIDYVMNHTSTQHPWFIASTNPADPKRDWYTWQTPAPVMTGPWGQTVWHPSSGSNFYGIFWSGMPDLNYNTTEVKTEMFDIARFWMEDMNVDGFRLDAVKYIYENGIVLEDTPETIQFWKDFRTYYKSIDGNALAVGEAWTSTDKVQQYVSSDGLDYCFEFDLAGAIIGAAKYGNVANLSLKLDEVISSYPHLQYGTFLTNHDMNRVMNELAQNVPKAKVAASLLLTLPGVPYLYYGEEIGMTGVKPDENIRTPLQWDNTAQAGFTNGTPWRAVNTDYTTKNIKNQKYEATSLWNSYRKLISIRTNHKSLRKGDYKSIVSSSSSLFAFLRQYEEENIIVVSNPIASAVSNFQLNYTQGGITPGNYTLIELQTGAQESVVVDISGNFSNLSIAAIQGFSTLIYKLIDASEVNTSVTFKVNMNEMIVNGNFNPSTETVDIVGSFNNFGSTILTLSDIDADGIYTIVLSDLLIGSPTQYKYRINGAFNGREEFSNSTYYREYLVLDGNHAVLDIYQINDEMVSSVIESFNNSSIATYPNPASDELYIESKEGFIGKVQYQILDVMGKVKEASFFDSNVKLAQYKISCEALSDGMYTLSLNYDGINTFYKIIIQK